MGAVNHDKLEIKGEGSYDMIRDIGDRVMNCAELYLR